MRNEMAEISRSILASILIGLGVYGLLKTHYSEMSMILFALGLYTICLFKLNLFTGKCGYCIEEKSCMNVLKILSVNYSTSVVVGLMFGINNPDLVAYAQQIVNSWDFSVGYFIKSILCGFIMFLAVHTYKNKSVIGIFLGVPMFIMCGFQHCIANSVILGVAWTFSYSLFLAVAGNWVGSIIAWFLFKGSEQ